MAPSPTPPEEIAQLMRFIAEKVKNVKSPMNVTELCRQFQKETGSLISIPGLTQRISSHRGRIHEMNEFNTDTKVKMIFALSASVDTEFLIELKKVADVEVDDNQRIIQYKQKDGGLEFSGRHLIISTNKRTTVPLPPEEIAPLMKFMAEKSKDVVFPMNIKELCRQFKKETGSFLTMEALTTRIKRYRQKIHEMDEFDMDTKVKMIFALRASIDAGLLAELEKVADVQVDDQQRIIQYRQKDSGLELRVKHLRLLMDQGEQRDKSIIQFLVEKSKTVHSPMVDAYFVKEFKETSGCPDSIESLTERYRRVKNTIYQIPGIDKNTKIKMMFISNAKLFYDTWEELQNDAIVEVDEERRITKYQANDGSLELEGDHSLFSKQKTAREDMKRQWLESISNGRKRARDESLKVEDDWSLVFITNNAEDFGQKLIDCSTH